MVAADPTAGPFAPRMAAAVWEGAAMIAADTGRPPDDVAPCLAVVAAAIAMEIIATPPGTTPDHAE